MFWIWFLFVIAIMNRIPDALQRPVEDVERALPLIGFFIARQFCTEGYNILSRVLWCSQNYPNFFWLW